jgi:hypothetical protein
LVSPQLAALLPKSSQFGLYLLPTGFCSLPLSHVLARQLFLVPLQRLQLGLQPPLLSL